MHRITKTAAVLGMVAFGALSVSWFSGAHSIRTTLESPQPKVTVKSFPRPEGINKPDEIKSNSVEESMSPFPPRTITPVNEAELDRFLKIASRKPDVTVECISFDVAGVELAKEIASIFSRNGFSVRVSQITPRFVNYGLSATVPADPSDTNLVNAVWKLFDHLHLDGFVYVGVSHTNLAIKFGMGRR